MARTSIFRDLDRRHGNTPGTGAALLKAAQERRKGFVELTPDGVEAAADAPPAPGPAASPGPTKTMLLTYKYRLNPDRRQHRDLKAYATQDQQLGNAALEERMAAYRGVGAARHELAWGTYTDKHGQEREGYVRQSLAPAKDLHPARDTLMALLALGRKPSRAAVKKWRDAVAAAEAAGTEAPEGPDATGPKVTATDVLNRRRWILASVLTEPLTLAQRLDMLDRLEPVSVELREDLEAFHAGRAALATRLAAELLAPVDPRRALTHGRLVAEMQRRWETAKHSLSNIDQSRALTEIRAADPAYAGRQRRVQRNTLNRLQKTFDAFFSGGGHAKFKSERFALSFGFDAFQQITYENRRLRFAGIAGGLRHMKDRPLPQVPNPETGALETRIKGIHFKAEDKCLGRVSRWYVGFQVEVPVPAPRTKGKSIGVDWGTSVLAALSSGEVIPNPRFGELAARVLRRAQRTVARRPDKASRRRAKALRHKRAGERKTANRRRTYFDKVSKRFSTHYRTVCAEMIATTGLMNAERPGEAVPASVKTRRNREALDAAPYLLRQMTAYKTTLHGAEQIVIDPAAICSHDNNPLQPTQRCPMCKGLHFKTTLDEPWHVCTTPGVFQHIRLPRKVAAARVVEMAAFGEFGTLSPADDDRGGPVPGGAAKAANVDNSRRRLGKTAEARVSTGWRSPRELPTHTHGQAPRPPPGRLRTEPS